MMQDGRGHFTRRLGLPHWTGRAVVVGAVLIAGLAVLAVMAWGGRRALRRASAAIDVRRGQTSFERRCASCHGIEGAGGTAPTLQRARLTFARTEDRIPEVIRHGIPERGMPAHTHLSAGEIRQLAAYVTSLGRGRPIAFDGDTARGRELFMGKGECRRCHVVDGVGGVTGPDLTSIGLTRSPEFLRQALLEPSATLPSALAPGAYEGAQLQYLPVQVTLQNGTKVSGLRLSEDGFSIQLRDDSGGLHSIMTEEIRAIERFPSKSLMPSARERLDEQEIRHVIAFLISRRGGS